MSWPEPKPVPEGHPIRLLFRTLTARGLAQAQIPYSDFIPYYYAEQGRLSYSRAADMYRGTPVAPLLRKLSDHFESCAVGLHWVREYTHDPFYQYMLRQYGWM